MSNSSTATATLERSAAANRTREERDRDFETWVREVRDPAAYRSEGERTIVAGGKNGIILTYEVSPLPRGWALSFQLDFPGYSGGGVGVWTLYPTRPDAIDFMLRHCLERLGHEEKHAGSCITNANRLAIPIMRRLLDPGDLFGFQEPEAPPRSEWWDEMIADQVSHMTLEQSWDLIDVIRGMNFKPLSKSGS